MQIDFDKLRESIRINFNDLCTIATESQFRYDEAYLMIQPHSLEIALEELRNDIVVLCSLINPESGKIVEGDIYHFNLEDVEIER